METDTDSIYIAVEKENFEDNIAEDKHELYDKLKHEYFITDECKYGKREPNRYKIECEGRHMIALCLKSYCVYDNTMDTITCSLKGVQKQALFNNEGNVQKCFSKLVVVIITGW